MSGNGIAVLFGVVAALGYGLADFWAARASKKIGPVTALLAVDFLMLVVYLPVYFFLPETGLVLTAAGTVYAALGAIFLNAASILFFKGLAAGPVSIVSPLSAAYPLVSALLAIIAFNAQLSVLQIAAVFVIVGGIMAASGLFDTKAAGKRIGRGPLLGLLSMFFYGGAFSCLAQASTRISWQNTTLIEFIVLLAVVILSAPLVQGKERAFRDFKTALKDRFVMSCALAAVVTITLFNMGFTYEQAGGAIIIAVSACYPVVTVALALRHFKEEIRPIPLIGAAATVAGVVTLSIG